MHVYKVNVTRVIDGDSIVGELQTHIMDIQIILPDVYFRLLGIDTPEKTGDTKAEGLKAKEYLELLILGKDVVIKSEEKDKYGRQLAEVYLDGLNINKKMLDDGYAVRYE